MRWMPYLVAVGATIAGCVSAGMRPPEPGGHDVITQQELEHVRAASLYDAIHKLRPAFLRNRAEHAYGLPATAELMVYVDEARVGGVDDLRLLSIADVLEVRFYEPQIANAKFGRYNNAGGAIAVTLRKP